LGSGLLLGAPAGAEAAPSPALGPPEPRRAFLDYADGSLYLRGFGDNLIFMPAARMHIDSYAFAGPGVGDYQRPNGSGLKLNLFFRRFVLEMGGLILKKWTYWLGGNFAPTQVDANQAPLSSANVYDGFIGYVPIPQVRVYLGQYNAPFSMENVTSSRWLDLMERALCVRTLATPYNKADGLMVWAETPKRTFEGQAGVFGGDGMNRPSLDNRVDGMARFVVRPLSGRRDALRLFHLGVGGRYGSRDPKFVQYDAPALSTPGGYAFWSPTYTTEQGERIHVVATGRQAAASAEAYLPFTRFDVRGELVYVNENRRETPETDKGRTLRLGALTGFGSYFQLSVWLLGTPRISGNPASAYGVLKVPNGPASEALYGLQLVLRGELMRARYDGNARGGATPGDLSRRTDDITVNAYQAGLTYWATKHVRLTTEYSLYRFPGGPGSNQAVAPGVKSGAAPDAHLLHEMSFRAGLAL